MRPRDTSGRNSEQLGVAGGRARRVLIFEVNIESPAAAKQAGNQHECIKQSHVRV